MTIYLRFLRREDPDGVEDELNELRIDNHVDLLVAIPEASCLMATDSEIFCHFNLDEVCITIDHSRPKDLGESGEGLTMISDREFLVCDHGMQLVQSIRSNLNLENHGTPLQALPVIKGTVVE